MLPIIDDVSLYSGGKLINWLWPQLSYYTAAHNALHWDHTAPEFLKAAIMQSHDCPKYLRIYANFGGNERKTEKKTGSNFMYLTKFS